MTKFKKHKDQLFRMLDEPDAINEFSKTPCVIACKYGDLKKYYILDSPTSNPSMSMLAEGFEIIGYPVADGSAEWMIYQSMQGRKGIHPDITRPVHYDGECMTIDGDEKPIRVAPSLFISSYPNGWEIYKEPEPEQPKYKVGDWVEFESSHIKGETFVSVIKEMPNQKHYTVHVNSFCGGYYGIMERQIVRKLKPSEVIVNIGCLSGTVNAAIILRDAFYLKHSDCSHSLISFTALDAPTRELVESLLEAMQEEEK